MTTGILNVDKPLELTSHDVVSRVRRVAGTRRVGHAGTLDPLATGVLVVAVGPATRLLEYVVGQRKLYEASVRLGQTTTTYDAEGAIVEEQPVRVEREDVEQALEQFRGAIEQVPPMYSAVKVGGRPLYDLARQGVEVEREAREVTIYRLVLERWQPPFVDLHIACSAGTYIRSLAHDLGQALGCGAYLAGLRRSAVGPFTTDTAVPLDALTPENLERHLQPLDSAVAHLPRLDLSAAEARALANGQRLARQATQPTADLVRAYDADGRFIGVIAREGTQWQPKKILYHT